MTEKIETVEVIEVVPLDESSVENLGGRPLLYDESFCDHVRALARLGLAVTDKQIAAFFGVDERTVYRWKAQFPEFCQAVREGKTFSDAQVAQALYERATGYRWTEQRAFKCKDTNYGDNGKKLRETERVEVVDVQCFLPPDVGAASFWLRNRHPDLWKDGARPEDPSANLSPKQEADRQARLAEKIRKLLPPPAG